MVMEDPVDGKGQEGEGADENNSSEEEEEDYEKYLD